MLDREKPTPAGDSIVERRGCVAAGERMQCTADRWLAVAAVGITAATFYPILYNYFLYDDFLHLYDLANLSFIESLLKPNGGHPYLVRNAIFHLLYAVFGAYPPPFFVTALLTHLLNVYLVFQVIRLLTADSRLACLSSALWGTAPINEGVLGWYAVYGQALVATIFLWILYDLCRITAAKRTITAGTCLLWYFLLLVACTCFGIGIALSLPFGLVLFLLLPPSGERSRVVLLFCSLLLVVPILYYAIQSAYSAVSGHTESGVFGPLSDQLWQWRPVWSMLFHLITDCVSSLILGRFRGTTSLGDILSYSVTGLFILATLVVCRSGTRVLRKQLAAFFLILFSSYGLIAFARANVLARWGQTAAWAAAAPRYHYFGPLVACIILSLLLHELWATGWFRRWRGERLAFVAMGLVVVANVQSRGSIDHHDPCRRETQMVLETIHAFGNRQSKLANIYVPNQYFTCIGIVDKASFPGWAAVFVIFNRDNVLDGKQLYFVEADHAVIAAAKASHGMRIGSLLVSGRQR